MFARRVSVHLKPDCSASFTEKMETGVLPLLRKQNGFKDAITFLSQDRTRVFGISIWDTKESAEIYARDTYPHVERLLAPLVDGDPKFGSYIVSNSTYKKATTTVPA